MQTIGYCVNSKCNKAITMNDFVDPDQGIFECPSCHSLMPSENMRKPIQDSRQIIGLHYEDERLHSLFSETLTEEDEETARISEIAESVHETLNTKHGSIENMLRLCTLQDLVDNLTWDDMLSLHRLVKRKMAESLKHTNVTF